MQTYLRPPASHALPYVEHGHYKVPRQHLYTGGNPYSPAKTNLNWNRIRDKSAKLISLAANNSDQIRNNTLRRFAKLAALNNLTMTDTNVVYAAVHSRTSRFYIGSTKNTALKRLQQHYHGRNTPNCSRFSAYLSRLKLNHSDMYATIFVFPILRSSRRSLLSDEENFIHHNRNSRQMLNHNERKSLSRARVHNRQHRPPPHERPPGPHAAHPPRMRRSEVPLLNRLLDESEPHRERLLKSISDKRLTRLIADAHAAQEHALCTLLRGHKQQREKKTTPAVFPFSFPFSRRVGNISLRRLFLTGIPLPQTVQKLIQPRVYLNPTLGSLASNAAFHTINGKPEEATCRCQDLLDAGAQPEHFRFGHLATNDISSLNSLFEPRIRTQMAAVWAQGAKFRFALDIEDALKDLQERLDKFIKDLGESDIISPHFDKLALNFWSMQVLDRYEELASSETNFHVTKAVLAAISNLRKMFIITPVDKNPQSLAFMCPKAYFERLEEHMKSPTYEKVEATPLEILSTHKDFSQEFGVTFTPVLPYVYSIVKLHKDPSRPADRFIAGHSALNRFTPQEERAGSVDSNLPIADAFSQRSQEALRVSQASQETRRKLLRQKPDTSLSKVGRKLSNFLNSIIDVLLQQDEINILKGGPRKIWILRDIAEAQRLFTNCSNIHTADFSTMYTNLPINDSFNDVSYMVEMALKFLCTDVFNVNPTNITRVLFHDTPATNKKEKKQMHCSWSLQSSTSTAIAHPHGAWNLHLALKALKFIMNNSYYVNVFGVFRQQIGVGMGCEPSAPAANLALAAREMKWVTSLKPSELSHYGKFIYYGRYIDDLASSSPLIKEHGVPGKTFPDYYGMDIVVTGSTHTHDSVDFLSYTFHRRLDDKMRISLKDKQTTFPILLIRYPSDSSTINEECKIGCVVGGLVTIARVIDTPFYYKRELDRFFDKLRQRRFTSCTLLKGILKYVHRNVLPKYKAYMLANYFRPIIDRWPFHTPVPGKAFVSDYIRRHDLHQDVPFAWRQRIEEIQFINQTTASSTKYGCIRRHYSSNTPLDWLPILTDVNSSYFPHPPPPSHPPQSSSRADRKNVKHNSGSPNYESNYFRDDFYSSPDRPSQRARAVSPVRSSSTAHPRPTQSEDASSQPPLSQSNPSPSVDGDYEIPPSSGYSYQHSSNSADHRRYSSVPQQPSAPCLSSGLNQSPRSHSEISLELSQSSDSNFIPMEQTPDSPTTTASFEQCSPISSSVDTSFENCQSPSN